MPASKRKPWRRYFPQDWLSDPLLRACSLGARGLWADLMCVAWLSPEEGFIIGADGNPLDVPTISRMVSDNPGSVRRYLAELSQQGVYSTDERGVMYSRRIVADAEKSRIAAQNGRKGGNPALVSDKAEDKPEDNQCAYPSSAYASALGSSVLEEESAERRNQTGDGPGFLAFWYAYPARIRTKQSVCIAEWNKCLAEGHDPALIVAKATEYGTSPQGLGEYATRAPGFLEGRMFLDPPEAWQRGSEGPQKPARDYDAMVKGGGW